MDKITIKTGHEALVEVYKDKVIKKYNNKYYKYNEKYKRKGESYFLNKYRSGYFIELIESDERSITMPYLGKSIGDFTSIRDKTINVSKFIPWIKGLKNELNKFRLQHRDISPANILYDIKKDKFTLIDFSWCIEEGDEDTLDDNILNNLNKDYGTDDEAIYKLIKEAEQILIENKMILKNSIELINKIGSGDYKDGSFVIQGRLYHPIPFNVFKGIMAHKSEPIIQEYNLISNDMGVLPKSVFEIGAANGYYSFNLARLGHNVTAVEGDVNVYNLNEYLRKSYKIRNLNFLRGYINDVSIKEYLDKKVDIVLMMNVHMWIHKQIGDDKTIKVMKHIRDNCETLYFQTSHKESGGMYVVEALKNEEDIVNYLNRCGFKSVEKLQETNMHGGTRILFKAS